MERCVHKNGAYSFLVTLPREWMVANQYPKFVNVKIEKNQVIICKD